MNRLLRFELKSRSRGMDGFPMRFATTILAEPLPKTDQELLEHVATNGGALVAEYESPLSFQRGPLKWISVEEFSEKWKGD